MPINTKELDVKLEKILKKVFKIEKINLEGSIEDISEWDSFTHIQLINTIEEEFKIKVEFNDAMVMTSIPIIKKKIMNYLSMKESISLAKHQQISKNFKIDYNNIRELFYEKVKARADEIFLICPGENTVEFTYMRS